MTRARDDAQQCDAQQQRRVRETLTRPELISLDPGARRRVAQQITAKGGHCASCGATRFDVGDALYLGFLFLDEDQDAYMVALTCCTPECTTPRTGIILRDKDFLIGTERGGEAARRTDRVERA